LASTQRRLKWPYVLGILAGILAGLILFVLLKVRNIDDQTRRWVVSELQRRFNSEVELESLHVSHSLQKIIRKGVFRVSLNRAFREVIAGCAAPGLGRRTTWITPEFLEAYTALHEQSLAHSLEVWQGDRLVVARRLQLPEPPRRPPQMAPASNRLLQAQSKTIPGKIKSCPPLDREAIPGHFLLYP